MPAWWPLSRTRRPDRADRLRRYWDRHARSFDRQMAFFERVLFGDGRQWVCAQATGEVLDVAVGGGRNLPFYPQGLRLTGVDFSPRCCSSPSSKPSSCAVRSTCAWGTPRRWSCRTPASTRWSAPLSLCAHPR
jgi:hypothetical protein